MLGIFLQGIFLLWTENIILPVLATQALFLLFTRIMYI